MKKQFLRLVRGDSLGWDLLLAVAFAVLIGFFAAQVGAE